MFWLGYSFEGLPLTSVSRIDADDIVPETRFIISYGNCRVPRGAEGCPIPLSITIGAYRLTPCAEIAEVFGDSAIERRGAVFQWTGGDAILWTNDVYVSLAATSRELIDKAVRNLIRLNEGGPRTPDEPLGPPVEFDCSLSP